MEIKESLNGYLDGEARGDEVRLVEEHLSECAGCRDLARRMRNLGLGVERIEGAVPSDFRETLFARMEREGFLPRRRSLFVYSIRWAAVPVAAAAVLALFVLTSRETGVKESLPPAERPTVAEGGTAGPREALERRQALTAPETSAQDAQEPRVAGRPPEESAPAAAAGSGGAAVADSRAGLTLTPEERDIVAYLEILEDPAALDDPAEIDELEIEEPAGREKG